MFSGSATLTPVSVATKLVSAGDVDAYVAKLTAAGAPVWGVRVGAAAADVATDLVVDSAGYIYVSGVFEGKVDFNPASSATSYLSSAGGADGFILKLSNAGKYAKATRFGATKGDGIWDLATRSGYLYAAGVFSGSATYGTARVGGTSKGGEDLLFAKIKTSDLSMVWAHADGDVKDDWGIGIAVDASNNVIGAGFLGGSATLDLNDAPDLLSGGDILVGKLSSSGKVL